MVRPTDHDVQNSPEPCRFGTVTNSTQTARKRPMSSLELGPRKRPAHADPLVHHGRHFGRSVFAFANIQALLLLGLASHGSEEVPETQQERREQRVFRKLLKLVPSLEDRLLSEDMDESGVLHIATLVESFFNIRQKKWGIDAQDQLQKGASSARSDDTKSLKSAVVDWIAPSATEPLQPSIARNVKLDRGFNHERTGFLLCPPGLDWSDPEIKRQLKSKELIVPGNHWPMFVYADEKYDPDEPWRGLFRSKLLLSAYKHIFTSPSSVDDDPKSTRSGNARIHGMTTVTPASVAYVATQLRFSLSSASVFCRTDKETDSETFYTSVLELFEDPEEQEEVKDLMQWWNRRVFPSFSSVRRTIPANSALSKIKEKRAALQIRNAH